MKKLLLIALLIVACGGDNKSEIGDRWEFIDMYTKLDNKTGEIWVIKARQKIL